MSAATIDGYLAPARAKDPIRGNATTKPGRLLRNSITVREAGDEVEAEPGFFEVDTVAHCGPARVGEFARSVSYTDMHTRWVFTRSIRNKAWYMGEHPEEFDDGEFDKAPTWFHNVADGKAGIAMPGDPQVSERSFSEGWSQTVDFTDRGRVVAIDKKVCITLKCFEPTVVIEEFAVEEPNATQIKYYAQGVGNVKVGWRGDDSQREELELVTMSELDAAGLATFRKLALTLETHAYKISKDVYGATKPMA